MNSASKQECIDQQRAPKLQRGDTVPTGHFLRNISKDDVSRIYAKAPAFGLRLKPKNVRKWRDFHAQTGFSVNELECICTPSCSILVHPNAGQFHHVWEIDLEFLNEAATAFNDNFVLVAQYLPEQENLCHFEIIAIEGGLTPTLLLLLLESLFKVIPPEGNDPKGNQPLREQEMIAEQTICEYHRFVKIHFDPLGRLSSGAEAGTHGPAVE